MPTILAVALGTGWSVLSRTTPLTRVWAAGPDATPVALNTTGTPSMFSKAAATMLLEMPGCSERVSVTAALPSLSVGIVTVVRPSPRWPPPCAANVTGTPDTGLPPASRTITTNGIDNGLPTMPTKVSPITAAGLMWTGGPTVAEAQNISSPTNPGDVTDTWLLPAPVRVPSWNIALAWPRSSLTTETDRPSSGKAFTTPSVRATVKVTGRPGSGRPKASWIDTTSGSGSVVPIIPDWLLPDSITIRCWPATSWNVTWMLVWLWLPARSRATAVMVLRPRASSRSPTTKLRFETAAGTPFTVTVACSAFTVPVTMSLIMPVTVT